MKTMKYFYDACPMFRHFNHIEKGRSYARNFGFNNLWIIPIKVNLIWNLR